MITKGGLEDVKCLDLAPIVVIDVLVGYTRRDDLRVASRQFLD